MWADQESKNDYLNFGEVSQLAVEILNTSSMLPISLGIFGNWGAGKSSLLNFVEHELRSDKKERLIVKFDAWLYQGFDDARASLLEAIAVQLNTAARGNESLLKKTRRLLQRVDGFRALGLLTEGAALALGVPTGGVIARGIASLNNATNGVDSEEEFAAASSASAEVIHTAQNLIKATPNESPPQQIDAFRKEYGEVLSELGAPLIVMIDNLDRCLPTNAIQTLEAIRLFLFLPNTAFVIAADEEMIRLAVAEHFKGSSERHQIDYLDKLIQVPIRVPKSGTREIRSYLFMLYSAACVDEEKQQDLRNALEANLQSSWKSKPISIDEALKAIGRESDEDLRASFELADRIAPVLARSPSIQGNPRIVKRLLNVVRMRSLIATRRGIPLDETIITKMVIFERCAGSQATADLYRLIDSENGHPKAIADLELAEDGDLPPTSPKSWSEKNLPTFIRDWALLEPRLRNVDLRPAIYLSRETMPISIYRDALSNEAKAALDALLIVTKVSSPTAKKTVSTIPVPERVVVMQELVSNLRRVTDWQKQPAGFAGCCLLARESPEAALILTRFISTLGKQPPWLSTLLKSEDWGTK